MPQDKKGIAIDQPKQDENKKRSFNREIKSITRNDQNITMTVKNNE
ncbi:hypothetical protein KKH82_08790 [Patescibacteria group bacterium]|nr:hypothetical protein [Patescibacteria group bacterium]